METRALLSSLWRGRTGPLLVAAQVALTLAVIVNVAYIVQQRLSVMNEPTGLDLDNMFWVQLQLEKTNDGFPSMVQADEQYLNALPDVVAAAISGPLPQTWDILGLPFASEAALLEKPGAQTGARIFLGGARYLEVLGVKLVAGRTYDPAVIAPPGQDMIASIGGWPAETVVTKAFADKLFPKGDGLGKTFYVGLVNRPSKIVGIIDELRGAPLNGPEGSAYARQNVIIPVIPPGPTFTYLVRTKPGRRDAVMAVVEKDLVVRAEGRFFRRIQSMERTARITRAGMRFSTIVLSTVAGVVALVTMLGIAGLAAFNVAARRKQLGTRRALGARKFHILRYFIVENWLITTLGCVVGCALAIAIGLKMSQIYQLPRLPLYYLVGGVLGTWALGLLAVVLPARRAASISPAIATRTV